MSDSQTVREMGRIVRPHGVLGELKIAPETDDPTRFQSLKTILVGPNSDSTTSFDILSVRLQQSKYGITVIVQLSGIESREEAEKLNKLLVFSKLEDLPELEEGEYFLSDLIGLQVFAESDVLVGQVIDVIEGRGHNLLLVRRESKPDVMIPMVDAFIEEIDFDSDRITIMTIEGLLD